ncbi:hypothetical protein [Azohydromonas aeria]|uniref:hypothetical protein n=1 Tax=Azohydromonas aeria TaxID=2590212 RepID=UPI0012FA45B7|nr:hypothetical protein [Azohydromonas aeria]
MLLHARSLPSFLHVLDVGGPGRPAQARLKDAAGAAGAVAGAPGALPAQEQSIPPEGDGAAARFHGEDGMALLSALAG